MDSRVVAAPPQRARGSRPLSTWLALLLVIATGVNIRAIFGVTPPLIPVISADLDLSGTTASLLTSMPILAMALCAPLGHVLSTRLGPDWAMVWLLGLLSVAELSRAVIDSAIPLVVTAGLIGGALGALSTLTPALIVHHLPHRRGLATGVYSTSMALGVGLAAGTAQPIADVLGGWRMTLAVWGLLAWVIIAVTLAARWAGAGMVEDPGPPTRVSLPLREARAWFVTAVVQRPDVPGLRHHRLAAQPLHGPRHRPVDRRPLPGRLPVGAALLDPHPDAAHRPDPRAARGLRHRDAHLDGRDRHAGHGAPTTGRSPGCCWPASASAARAASRSSRSRTRPPRRRTPPA